MAFVDAKKGAAIFEAAGLAVTTDGGASWKIADDGGHGDALRAGGLRRAGKGLRAYAYAEGPDAAIDLDAARLGPFEQLRAPEGEPRLLRWIRATGRDPLETAAAVGLDLRAEGALVASHGQLARVDPASGSLLDLVEFAHGKDMSPCGVGRDEEAAWVTCYLSDDQGGKNLFDPYGVLHVPLAKQPLDPGRPALIRNGEAEMRGSPSGGVLLLGPCSSESEGEACVRQPDGKWVTFHSDIDFGARGTGPLADGRIAFLRGLFDGDDPAEADADRGPGAQGGAGDEAEARGPAKLHIALRDAAGKETDLPGLNLAGNREDLKVLSPIEEDADHSLHFVIESSEGLFSVVQSPARRSASVQAIPGAFAAKIHAGKGLAVGEQHALATIDGGLSWSEIAAPPGLFRSLDAHSYAVDDPAFLMVSELGAKVAHHLRLGWGPSAAPPAEHPQAVGPLLVTPPPQDRGPQRVLQCKSEGAAQSTPPLLGAAQVKGLLAGKAPPSGTRREGNAWSGGRAGMLDTIALLEEEGPDRSGAPPSPSTPPRPRTLANLGPPDKTNEPTTWTLRWFDAGEVGAKPRSFTGPVPANTTWGTGLRFAAASGPRALFVLHRNRNQLPTLLRVLSNGKAETASVSYELLPQGEVVFASDKSEIAAWMNDTTVVVWAPGEPPRAVAMLSTHAVRTLGQPARDGVPILLGSSDWAMTRTLPIPALDKKAGMRPPPPAPPSLDGWARVPFLPRDTGALPACAASAKGSRFVVARGTLGAQVDGVDEQGSQVLYELRLSGAEACVSGVRALLTPERRPRPAAPPDKAAPKGGKKPPAHAGGPVAFVRADLAGKKAEGGDRGVPPAAVRRLSCSLSGKP
ncbi:MAG: hypothetical protein U0359_40460 [Byssovorax sp.]